MFRFGKIPITIFPIFLIVAALIGWLSSGTVAGMLVWMAVILVSVFIHECGHALTAIAFGQKARIEFMAFGGLTHRKGRKLKLWQEFFVVLNGPCAGFLLGTISLLLLNRIQQTETLLHYGLMISTYVNFFWTFLNLMPIYPLDGGHLLSIILQGLFGFRGLRYSLFLSMIFAGSLSLLFFAFRQPLAGAILLIMAFESYRTWRGTMGMTESDQNEKLQNELKRAEELIAKEHYHEAFDLLESIRIRSKRGIVYNFATEDMAKVLEEMEDDKKAYELLEPIENQLSPEGLRLFHHLSYRTKKMEKAAYLGDRTFQIHPSYDVALINAFSHASLGHVEQTIGWLKRAMQEGAPNIRETLSREEFNRIREEPAFQQWAKTI